MKLVLVKQVVEVTCFTSTSFIALLGHKYKY
jgi:hypothetical protein